MVIIERDIFLKPFTDQQVVYGRATWSENVSWGGSRFTCAQIPLGKLAINHVSLQLWIKLYDLYLVKSLLSSKKKLMQYSLAIQKKKKKTIYSTLNNPYIFDKPSKQFQILSRSP